MLSGLFSQKMVVLMVLYMDNEKKTKTAYTFVVLKTRKFVTDDEVWNGKQNLRIFCCNHLMPSHPSSKQELQETLILLLQRAVELICRARLGPTKISSHCPPPSIRKIAPLSLKWLVMPFLVVKLPDIGHFGRGGGGGCTTRLASSL